MLIRTEPSVVRHMDLIHGDQNACAWSVQIQRPSESSSSDDCAWHFGSL